MEIVVLSPFCSTNFLNFISCAHFRKIVFLIILLQQHRKVVVLSNFWTHEKKRHHTKHRWHQNIFLYQTLFILFRYLAPLLIFFECQKLMFIYISFGLDIFRSLRNGLLNRLCDVSDLFVPCSVISFYFFSNH